MPEGDTTWRTARALHAALAGKTVVAFASSLPAVTLASRRLGLVGRTLEAVEARGKHLLVRFAGGAMLHTHQGMRGSWRLHRRGVPARWPGSARAVIETADVVAVCTLSPVVEVLSPSQAATHPALARLGPDLLAPGFDPEGARRRLRARGDLEVAAALLDQTALAGIGNVYKSEVLFLCGVSPFTRVRDLDDATIDRLVARAGEMLRRNLGPGGPRRIPGLPPGRLWVYRRSGQPCRKCGTRIERAVQGEQARSTYFCPLCQRSAGSAGSAREA
ncbi:MAG TPA: DNA-formamidopyrimidine glycosylase family protein [Vicinamibacteria bacterium]|nr:DNA-formamidopyrimidine glycosylase family protein [Vicinamibacteria bacterium]